jgi:hypothetical protein
MKIRDQVRTSRLAHSESARGSNWIGEDDIRMRDAISSRYGITV